MNIYIWLLFIVGGFFLLYLGFKFKNEYPSESHIMLVLAGFFILMSGLFVLTVGVDFPNGEHIRNYPACSLCTGNWSAVYENVTDPNTNRTVSRFVGYEPSIGVVNGSNSSYSTTYIAASTKTYTYVSLKGGLSGSFGVSWALIFFAFAELLMTAFSFMNYKKSVRHGRSYSEEEE